MVWEALACVCPVTHSFISVQIINHIALRKVSHILSLLKIPVCLPILAFLAINSFEPFVNPTTCTLLCKADFKCTLEVPSVRIQAFTLVCSQVLAGPSSSTVADGTTSGVLSLCTPCIPYKRRALLAPLSFLLTSHGSSVTLWCPLTPTCQSCLCTDAKLLNLTLHI